MPFIKNGYLHCIVKFMGLGKFKKKYIKEFLIDLTLANSFKLWFIFL